MKFLCFISLIFLVLLVNTLKTQAQKNSLIFDSSNLAQINDSFDNTKTITEIQLMESIDLYPSLQNVDDVKRLKTNVLISSIGLGVSYAAPIIIDLAMYPEDDFMGFLLIPVAGPYIHLAKAGKDYYWNDTLRGLMILDAITQTVFATYFVISLANYSKSKKSKDLTFTASMNKITLCLNF